MLETLLRQLVLILQILLLVQGEFTCPKPDGLFGNPADSTAFFNCFKGKATTYYCGKGLLWNDKKSVCDWSADVTKEVNVTVATTVRKGLNGEIICPKDGLFGSPDNCVDYYNCVGDRAYMSQCTFGLVWNQEKHYCDWAKAVNCTKTKSPSALKIDGLEVKSAQRLPYPTDLENKLGNGMTIYLTFDDGPNPGTASVLEALRQFSIKATFFINSERIDVGSVNALLTIVGEGHCLGDHSYDHMRHNSPQGEPRDVYRGVEGDIEWFTPMNIDPVLKVLKDAGVSDVKMNIAANQLKKYKRLPYTNNWRVGPVKHDCIECTLEEEVSGRNGMLLADALAAQGSEVFGWDVEWEINPASARLRYGVETIMEKVQYARTQQAGQIVLLTHDYLFRPGGNDKDLLSAFIRKALAQGYKFSTIDQYWHNPALDTKETAVVKAVPTESKKPFLRLRPLPRAGRNRSPRSAEEKVAVSRSGHRRQPRSQIAA